MQENKVESVENVEVESSQAKVEEKKSVGKFIAGYFKGMGYDFIQSFKYNNMKLAGLLILIPGAIFGFFLTFHTTVVNDIIVNATDGTNYMTDLSGFMLFLMMLFGILNIFTGFAAMNKKNLGSVVLATITSVIMIVSGILYFVIVFRWMSGVNTYYNQVDSFVAKLKEVGCTETNLEAYAKKFILKSAGTETVWTNQNWYIYAIPAGKRISEYFNFEYVLSLGSVALCMVCSVAGCALGFKNYDRNYQKVDR